MGAIALTPLPPAEAIRFFDSKGFTTSFNWRDVWQEEHARAFTVAKVSRLDILQDIRRAVDGALRDGTTLAQFKRELTPLLQAKGWWGKKILTDPVTGERVLAQLGSPRRLKTIFEVNLRTAHAAGRWSRIERLKKRMGFLVYSAVLDLRVRPLHRSWHHIVLPVDHPWWNTHYPPNGWNCFPGDTAVRCDAKIGLKAWYSGEMVELHTGLGHRLGVTANHPILTRRGWVPAHQIQKGDELIGASGQVDAVVQGVVDDEQPPARAEDLFETLKRQGFRVVPVAADNFHGDARAMKGKIHIAGADGALMDIIETARRKKVSHGRFDMALHGRVEAADIAVGPALAGAGMGDAVLAQDAANRRLGDPEASRYLGLAQKSGTIERQDAALGVGVAGVGGDPGGGQLPLGPAGRLLDRAPFQSLSFGSPAQFDAGVAERPPEGDTTASGLFGHLLEANPGAIARDQVVKIRKFQWSGHVYDFSTSTGLIIGNGIVVSNCRCIVTQMSRRMLERRGFKVTGRPPGGKPQRLFDKRVGRTINIHKGIDKGWDYNVGKFHMRGLTPPPQVTPLRTSPGNPSAKVAFKPAPTPPTARLGPPGLPAEENIETFLNAFGATAGKPVVFTDIIGEPFVVSDDLFREHGGALKIFKRQDRGRFAGLLASTIKEPDEIWRTWEPRRDNGLFELRKRYLRAFLIEGREVPALVVVEVGRDGWKGVTAFSPDSVDELKKQRRGFLAYRRADRETDK